jgi:hypothetical protein
MSQFEIEPSLVTLAFEGHVPYGTDVDVVVEDAVGRMNEATAEHMYETVGLTHFFMAMGKEGKLRRFEFPRDDVVQGEFRGFEVTEDGLHLPVGIRMNVDLVPGSSPGVQREEVVPLWSESTKGLRVPTFDYQRPGGSILETIGRHMKIKL